MNNKLQAGNLFIMKMPNDDLGISWCAVKPHSQDEQLWFCVPGDQTNVFNEKTDICVETERMPKFTFRCDCGTWIHEQDVNLNNVIENTNADALQMKVREIAENPFDVRSIDPDYNDWIEELRKAVFDFANALHNTR